MTLLLPGIEGNRIGYPVVEILGGARGFGTADDIEAAVLGWANP
jgi:hypothetical protein